MIKIKRAPRPLVSLVAALLAVGCLLAGCSPKQETIKPMSYDANGDGILQSAEFPLPTGETFGLEQPYSTLYSLAAAAASETVFANAGNDGTFLMIPTLKVYGEFTDEEGCANYICGYGEQYFYDVGESADEEDAPHYSSNGGRGRIARLVVDAEGGFSVAMETLDGADNTQIIMDICGPLTELAQALISDGAQPVARLTPEGEQLLAAYWDYFFGTQAD